MLTAKRFRWTTMTSPTRAMLGVMVASAFTVPRLAAGGVGDAGGGEGAVTSGAGAVGV